MSASPTFLKGSQAARDENGAPSVSVVIVSDYQEGDTTWTDERAAIRAFTEDDPGVPFEIVVMQSLPPSGAKPRIPADIARLAPRVSVHFERSQRSAALKDAALTHCSGDLVAVVEADCLPQPGWLEHLVAAMREDPSRDVVNGRTDYGSERAMLRVASLLDRGFIEQRRGGKYVHVSNNGALYRRSVLERYPYPDDASPFVSAELRLAEMHKGGVRIGFAPRALLRHAYGGIPFLADVRRNKGYQAARILTLRRPRYVRRPAAWVALRAVILCMRGDFETVRSVGRKYLRWTDWPLLAAVFLAVRLPEFMGALSVRRPERHAAATKYR